MRTRAAGMLGIVAMGMAGASASASVEKADAGVQAVRAALEAIQRDDCDVALKKLKPQLRPERVAKLPEPVAGMAYHIAATCHARAARMKEARAMAVAATALQSAPDELWTMRLALELDDKDPVAAGATVLALTQGRGGTLNRVKVRWLYRLDTMLREAKQDDLRARVLEVTTDNAYDPDEPIASKDGFRERLAKIRLEQGDKAAAMALVARIESTSVLLRMSFDPKLGALVPEGFDPRATMERELTETRVAIQRHPGHLLPLTAAAQLLRSLGRPREALDLLETARAGGKSLADHEDAGEWANWWWDSVARTHEMLGDEAPTLAAFAEGAKSGERGTNNVSQVINLAHAQNRFGRHEDAIKGLPTRDADFPVSPYGAMEMRLARGCANVELGNAAAVATDRAFMEVHAEDHREAWTYLLLCIGDMDAAAAAVIADLENDDRRAQTLIRLSDYDPAPPRQPTYSFEKREGALKARADVKAAIERAGGTRRIPLQRGEL